MTPTELTLILGLAVTAASSVGVPVWLNRRSAALAKAEREAAAAAEAAATEVVSWEKINLALARERDALSVALREASVEHRHEILEVRNSFIEEADRLKVETDRLKQRTDSDLDRAHVQIQQLADEVRSLYGQLSLPLRTEEGERGDS